MTRMFSKITASWLLLVVIQALTSTTASAQAAALRAFAVQATQTSAARVVIRNSYRSGVSGVGVTGSGLAERAPSEETTSGFCSARPDACDGLLSPQQITLSDIQGVCDESAPKGVSDRASRSLLQALVKTATRRVTSTDAEDVAQGTLYKLLLNCKRVLEYKSPVRGVYGILRFEIVNLYRAKMRTDQLEGQHEEYFPSFDPTESYENADLIRRLYVGLSPRQREVLAGIYADMSGPEIAEKLSIGAYRVKEIRGTVSKKLRRLSDMAPGQEALRNP